MFNIVQYAIDSISCTHNMTGTYIPGTSYIYCIYMMRDMCQSSEIDDGAVECWEAI